MKGIRLRLGTLARLALLGVDIRGLARPSAHRDGTVVVDITPDLARKIRARRRGGESSDALINRMLDLVQEKGADCA